MVVSATVRPAVSLIVPARNEEACLGDCLESLVGQRGVNFEIIVVDDGSTDATRQIAASFPGVRLMNAPPVPSGWTGKNNAVVTGAQEARGDWLLFTDADTVHLPGSLTRSMAEASGKNVALLSYSPEQEVRGFWEKAIMPVVFAELAASYRPSDVSDPSSPAAAANGQYLLITREAYDAVGGHAAIATNLLEDVALARAVKSSGRRIFFRYGGDAVRTRMYRSFGQLKEGWTKNLALLFAAPMKLALLRISEFVLIFGGTALTAAAFMTGRWSMAVLWGLVSGVSGSFLFRRIRRAHFSWDANILSLFGLPIFSYLLLRSKMLHRRGKVAWKGREYARITSTSSEPVPVPRDAGATV